MIADHLVGCEALASQVHEFDACVDALCLVLLLLLLVPKMSGLDAAATAPEENVERKITALQVGALVHVELRLRHQLTLHAHDPGGLVLASRHEDQSGVTLAVDDRNDVVDLVRVQLEEDRWHLIGCSGNIRHIEIAVGVAGNDRGVPQQLFAPRVGRAVADDGGDSSRFFLEDLIPFHLCREHGFLQHFVQVESLLRPQLSWDLHLGHGDEVIRLVPHVVPPAAHRVVHAAGHYVIRQGTRVDALNRALVSASREVPPDVTKTPVGLRGVARPDQRDLHGCHGRPLWLRFTNTPLGRVWSSVA
mmetsp:Transcript_124641/g.399272  ORF Transcript_124641/g.399272 Transcript_124641/m.399272 type:complete len:304 (+) Transcript_124641:2131-3042(+)